MKLNIKEIIFWISLILAIVLLLWNVFGNSPSEFIAMVAIILMVAIKVWAISDKQLVSGIKLNALEENIKDSFTKTREDMNLIKNDLNLIKNKMKLK